MKYYYIYVTTNKINGKTYVGKHHGYIDDDYLGSGKLYKKAEEKYGKENFYKKVVAICSSNEELGILEKIYISLYRSVGKAEYNVADGGDGGNLGEEWYKSVWNSCHNKEYSEKISKALKNSKKYQEVVHSKEFADKIRETKRKNPYKHDEETHKKYH